MVSNFRPPFAYVLEETGSLHHPTWQHSGQTSTMITTEIVR